MLKKILILLAALLMLPGLYAAAGFWLIPRLAQDKLPEMLGEITGQSVQLQGVRFDPFDLSADLTGFELALADGKRLVAFDTLAADIDMLESLKQRSVVIASVSLRKPNVAIERKADGRLNFDELIEKISSASEQGQAESEGGVPPISIRKISLEEGQIVWRDAATGQSLTETLGPVNITLSEFTTRPEAKAQFDLNLKLASGGGLDLQGELNPTTLAAQGHVKLDDLALPKVWQMFLRDSMPLEIVDGKISLQADYSVAPGNASATQVLIDNGGIEVKALSLNETDKADELIHLPVLAATGIRFDLQSQQVHIAMLSSQDARLKAWLQADGQVNYQALFAASPETASSEETAATTAKPWRISLNELKLANYQLAFIDHSQTKPVEMLFDELGLSVRDYHNADDVKLPLQFSTRFNQSGRIKLDGDVGLSPFSANWAVELQQIKLKTFQTYLDPYVKLELTDGDLNTQGHLQLVAGDELQVNYQGDANIDSLITRDKVKNQDFVKWHNLELKQMVLDATRQDFKLAKVIFDRPYVRFTIKQDGSNNVSDIMVVKNADKPKTKSSTHAGSAKVQADSEPVVTIGKIEFKQGQSDFADYSLILPFVVKMNDLTGEVSGFASNTDSAAKLKLQGRVHDLATVKIGGSYHLKSGDSDIALSFKHLPLPLVTPYMAEFAGYRIEKGQMALDLNYTIKGAELSAQNKIFIDQLVLGEKVENPKAVSLPLELGVALLKDSDGKINLDFPITGSLEDPKFSVGSLVADVLVNVVTKAVSSPFKAIASLFDSDDDLSTIVFAEGNGELSAEEAAKLDQIAQALLAKPELVLEIKGMAYEAQDWPVMRSDALADILKKMKSGELRDKGEIIRSEYIELSEAEYQRLLAKFYAEVFPQKIDHSLFGKPRIKNQPDADFYSIARQELEAIMQPDPQRLNELAVTRANHIAKHLVEHGKVDRGRIYILATELKQQASEEGISSRLSLNVAS